MSHVQLVSVPHSGSVRLLATCNVTRLCLTARPRPGVISVPAVLCFRICGFRWANRVLGFVDVVSAAQRQAPVLCETNIARNQNMQSKITREKKIGRR